MFGIPKKKKYGYLFTKSTKKEDGTLKITVLALIFDEKMIVNDGKIDVTGLNEIIASAKRINKEISNTQNIFLFIGESKPETSEKHILNCYKEIVLLDFLSKCIEKKMDESLRFYYNPKAKNININLQI